MKEEYKFQYITNSQKGSGEKGVKKSLSRKKNWEKIKLF